MEDGTSEFVGHKFHAPAFEWLRSVAALTLGIGKCPHGVLSYDELLWWRWHKGAVECWMRTWRPCPVLTSRDPQWDLIQMLTFVGSAGSIAAERRGTITYDGYLLISHRLHRVPPELQRTFANPRYFTVSTYLALLFAHYCFPLLRALFSSLCVPSYLLKLPTGGVPSPAATLEPPETLADPARVLTKGDVLLPVESTRATGSTVNMLHHTPRRSAQSHKFFSSPTPNQVDDAQSDQSARSLNNAQVAGSLPRREDPKRVIIFQHGLLECSLSYILPLWAAGPNEPTKAVPRRLLSVAFLPITIVCRLCRYLIRQMTCLIPRTEGRECLKRLCHALPINVMLQDPAADIWLTNTRGNELTANLLDQRPRSHPIGYLPLAVNDYRRLFTIYTDEDWTYVDSAIMDCEAFYNMFFQYYRTSRLSISAVAFSQGCAVFALNAAFKAHAYCPSEPSSGLLRSEEKESSPLFPFVNRSGDGEESWPMADKEQQTSTPLLRICTPTGLPRHSTDEPLSSRRSPAVEQPVTTREAHSSWTSGIYSTDGGADFDSSISDHMNGACAGMLLGCEFCNMLPVHMVMINPPLVLKPFDQDVSSLSRKLRYRFVTASWTHLHYLVLLVTVLQSLIPVRFGLFGQIVVQYFLEFGVRPMHSIVADLAYKLVPSGITTRSNMSLWNKQMRESTLLGTDLHYIPASVGFCRNIWKIPNPPSSVDLTAQLPCSASIYAGMQDNIADSLTGASRLLRNGHASLRVLDLCENSVQLDLKTKMAINLIAGSSHVDILWQPDSNTKLHQLITHDIIVSGLPPR